MNAQIFTSLEHFPDLKTQWIQEMNEELDFDISTTEAHNEGEIL